MPASNVIAEISDGLGASVSIAYQRLTRARLETLPEGNSELYTRASCDASAAVRCLASGLVVVASTSSSDGIGGSRKQLYTYDTLQMHTDPKHGLLGFRRVTVSDPTTSGVSWSEFSQDWQNGFARLQIASGSSVGGVPISLTNATLTRHRLMWTFTASERAIAYNFDSPTKPPVSTTTTTNIVDDWGNVIDQTTSTNDWTGVWTTSVRKGFDVDESRWLLAKPRSLIETRRFEPASSNDAKEVSRSSTYVTDPLTGMVTKETFDSGDALEYSLRFLRDLFGNVIETNRSVPVSSTPTLVQRLVYDQRGQFPLQTINALGHVVDRTFDARFGVLLTTRDANKFTVLASYDAFGIKLAEWDSGGANTSTTRQWCRDAPECPPAARYVISTQTAGGGKVLEYRDVLDRVVRTKRLGSFGAFSSVDTTYDVRGRVAKQTEPYDDLPGDARRYETQFTYDSLDRLVSTVAPDGNATQISYDGYNVTTTDALRRTRTERSNAHGLLIETSDAEQRLVRMQYTPFGELERILVPGVSTERDTVLRRDKRGRIVSRDEPNVAQSTSFTYDAYGRLTRVENGGKRQEMQYDELDRLVRRTTSDGDTAYWQFDSATNGVGKLVGSNTTNGYSRTIAYDNIGRVRSETIVVRGRTFTNVLEYDSFGRLATVTFPGDYVIKRTYSTCSGALTRIGGGRSLLWRATRTNARNQVTREELGSTFERSYAFDEATGRSVGIKVDDVVGSGSTVVQVRC